MSNLYPLADELAESNQIDPRILYAIISQESQWNIYALRYEPEWKYLLNPDFYAAQLRITQATEIATQSMSWGLGQLMGTVFRELGYLGPMGQTFVPEINLKYACLKIQKIREKNKTLEDIFSCYNAGFISMKNGKYLNQGYVDSCMKYYQEYVSAQ